MARLVAIALLAFACAPTVTSLPSQSPHDLRGRIWSVEGASFVEEEAVVRDLAEADHVLLGETHDNPEHHRLQGHLIEVLAPPAVAFEMLDTSTDVSGARSPRQLARASDWKDSGWPDFRMYAPVFEAAYEVGARVTPAHPNDAIVGQAMGSGLGDLGADAEGLRLDRAPAGPLHDDLVDEIVRVHCGYAGEDMVEAMIAAQVLKDAWMARTLQAMPGPSVLVAGNGHVRTDRGVPAFLDGEVRVVSFVDVIDGVTEPQAYEERADYLWFTGSARTEDPCEAFRASLEAMGS